MQQLNMQDIYNLCKLLEEKGYDLSSYPIFIGDDEELNGIHCSWYCETFKDGEDSYEDIIKIMQVNSDKQPYKGILIS